MSRGGKPLALSSGGYMRIAVLGGGAMGMLYGGYLSRRHDVLIVDRKQALADKAGHAGLEIMEADGTREAYHPAVVKDSAGQAPADLLILFVKAMYNREALSQNKALIGPDTYLLTLQNGSGHEDIILEYTDKEHVLIGTTQHNSAVADLGVIRHPGSGLTCIGPLSGDASRLTWITDAFEQCGLRTECSGDIRRIVWRKLFTNSSVSALTGVLQMPMGYIASNPSAWAMCDTLIREAVAVAGGEGLDFDALEMVNEVRGICERNPGGLTSIYADLRDGRMTEVDTISGSVVRAGDRNGVPAPSHRMIVRMVHAMEQRNQGG